MDWQVFLTNEAISNYIVFIGGLIIGALGWALRSRLQKPSIIEVERVSETSLVDIAPEARNQLKVTFAGQTITELHQTNFSIRNIGLEPIENIELLLSFTDDENLQILDEALEDPLDETREPRAVVEIGPTENDKCCVRVAVPYLNPHKEYQDYLLLQVYSPLPLPSVHLVGGGMGWGTRYFDQVAYNERKQQLIAESDSFIVLFAASLVLLTMDILNIRPTSRHKGEQA